MSTDTSLSERLRQQVRQKLKSHLSVQKVEKLLMRAAFCLDSLERELAQANAHCDMESRGLNQKICDLEWQLAEADEELNKERQANVSSNRALATLGGKIHDLERQLATVAQAERERCIAFCKSSNHAALTPEGERQLHALAPHSAKESEVAQPALTGSDGIADTVPAPLRASASDLDHNDFASGLALTAGGLCSKCGFTYWAHRGHIIACPVCECEGLRAEQREEYAKTREAIETWRGRCNNLQAVADAAKAWLPYCYAGTESSAQSVMDNLVASVRALERGEVKSSKCAWVVDEDGQYATGCGNHFEITEGTPSENKMAYCCYCGKPIQENL